MKNQLSITLLLSAFCSTGLAGYNCTQMNAQVGQTIQCSAQQYVTNQALGNNLFFPTATTVCGCKGGNPGSGCDTNTCSTATYACTTSGAQWANAYLSGQLWCLTVTKSKETNTQNAKVGKMGD